MELKAKQELTRKLTAVKSVGRHTSAGLFLQNGHGSWVEEGRSGLGGGKTRREELKQVKEGQERDRAQKPLYRLLQPCIPQRGQSCR